MKRMLFVSALVALATAEPALAVPPALLSVGQQNRHPTATFSAPRASSVTVYVASKPDRASDGSFLSESIKARDILADSEIQSGQWLAEDQLDPGNYWVMLRASADFDSCYIIDTGKFDPACADGFSNVVPLVIPKPAIRYSAKVTAYKYLREATLTLMARPLGEKLAYRVCYVLKVRKKRCLSGTVDGYSWDSPADDSLTVSTRNLPTTTTFTWFVGGKRVASKRARVR
jgi:hypothetical protein